MMTKQNYESFAKMFAQRLQDARTYAQHNADGLVIIATIEADAQACARIFAGDNPRFDTARFLTACDVAYVG